MPRKLPFDIETVLARIREAVRAYPDAAMFALGDAGYRDVFQQLVACVISIRTRDETSLPAAMRLLARAPTADALAALGEAEIDALIRPATFHERKAAQLLAIARRTRDEFGGTLPAEAGVLRSFAGVGPKCANLALGVAGGDAGISVDIHVHRVTNRWGYVRAPTPERTMVALEAVLPRAWWVGINRLLVPFGRHICTGVAPKCPRCPVLAWCRQVGVE